MNDAVGMAELVGIYSFGNNYFKARYILDRKMLLQRPPFSVVHDLKEAVMVVPVVNDIYDVFVFELFKPLDDVFLGLEICVVELEDAFTAIMSKQEYLCLESGFGDNSLILVGNGVEDNGITDIKGNSGRGWRWAVTGSDVWASCTCCTGRRWTKTRGDFTVT